MLLEDLAQENRALRSKLEDLTERFDESLADYATRTTEVDWTAVSGDTDWDLTSCQNVAETLVEIIETNPLLKRAVRLRHAYVYSDGYNIYGSKAGLDRKMALVNNQAHFFNTTASLQRIETRAATGNYFFLYNKALGSIVHIPIAEIDKVITGDVDTSLTMFIRRAWTVGTGQTAKMWYRTQWNTTKQSQKLPATQSDGDGLDPNWVMYHFAFNRPAGSAIGVPDALAAMKWAEGYAEYLTNQSKLVRAYSRIAYKTARKSTSSANEAASAVATQQSNNTYGATVVGDLTTMPATGSNVDFNNGRPLAAMVAAALEVGVDSLLSGTVGASKSVSDMLDDATGAMMEILRADEKFVIDTMLVALGAPNAYCDFPDMDEDPQYRRIQTIAQALSQGIIWRDEARQVVIDWFDIQNPKSGLPTADDQVSSPTTTSDPVPSQGNSGAVGTLVGSNKDARDNGELDQ